MKYGENLKPTDTQTLRTFLYKKDHRYIDSLLWVLHVKNLTSDFQSLGIKEDIDNCLHAFEKQRYKANVNVPDLISKYLDECEKQLIPKEYLDWLEPNNKRQCNFIWATLGIQGYLNDVTMLPSQGNSNRHSIIIKALDRITKPNREKCKVIIGLRQQWVEQTRYKGFRYDWLDEKNQVQCQKALDFISKQPSVKSKGYAKPAHIYSSWELCNYYKFLVTIDCWLAPLSDKECFHEKIFDTGRRWTTTKSKPKKNPGAVQVTDKKSLNMLAAITKRIDAKNPKDVLRNLILEKHGSLSAPEGDDTETSLTDDSTLTDDYISPQKYSETTSELDRTKKALTQLEEKALSQLKTMCEKIVRLEGSELVSRKLTKAQVKKIKEKVEEKKEKLLSFKSVL